MIEEVHSNIPITEGGATGLDEDHHSRWTHYKLVLLDSSAPLLCAGITTYNPLKHYRPNKPGMKIRIGCLGGLGHVAVKIAKDITAEVMGFSTNPVKTEEALDGLKADHFIVNKDLDQMQVNNTPFT
ncbi:unnamed protein product [Lactuca saligna]|uniref:Alcohol dehydrogenase-like C-terminal domain-containing protein n=1 Tax=Lactuca saligna TaxID=75948 RepID=A0AA35UR07_LACSI|nr:unnamed protein product [Lactuca saligna]